MRDRHTRTATLTLVLVILGSASIAQAKMVLYDASLILHSFANDATGALQALPLGANCNPANGGTTCYSTTLHEGAPLTGTGMAIILGSAPFDFSIGKNVLRGTTSGSLPPNPGITYTRTMASLRNETGNLMAGKGPGSFYFVPTLGSGKTHVSVVAGKNQFGGVMQLIGDFGTRAAGSTSGGGMWVGSFPQWGWRVIGARYARTIVVKGSISFTSLGFAYPSVAVVTGFPWTTGKVSVQAAGGYGFSTSLVRSGYDNRTSLGIGTIQLVAPRLTHWSGGAHWGDIAILKVEFVPEPEGWVMLVAGSAFLATAYRARRKAR